MRALSVEIMSEYVWTLSSVVRRNHVGGRGEDEEGEGALEGKQPERLTSTHKYS